jgi:protease IV
MVDQAETSTTNWQQTALEKTLLASVVEQRSARRWGIFFKIIFFGYILLVTSFFFQGGKPKLKEHVALIDIMGQIGQGQEVEADQVSTSLRKAFTESKAKAVILRINSPGGSPVQSAYIYDEIRRLRAVYPDKKLYAVVVDLCASGGYFAAAAADEIYANPSSIIGSIGVLMPNIGVVDLTKKIGVEQRTLYAGKNKLFLDPLSPEKPEQVQFAQTLLDQIHQQFIKAVKEGRGKRLKPNDEMFTGLFWTGEQALPLGLIDGFGSAGFVAREVIGIEDIIDYTVSSNFLDKLASKFGASFSKQLSSELGLNAGSSYRLN